MRQPLNILGGKRLSGNFLPISVEYHITTTSDWTTFQILEGGWWSDFQVVEVIEGYDKLAQDILWNEKKIVISKRQFDRSKVVVYVRCTLKIIKDYLQSNITHLITKGDIESTVVRIIAEEKEFSPLINGTNVPNNPNNPLSFEIPVKFYLQALEEKRKIEKVKEKPNEKVELEKQAPHIMKTTFNELFNEAFEKKEPTEKDVEEVFEWLRSQGENATKFLEADICRELTFKTETYFWRFPNLKEKAISEARKTHEKIRKRFDDLRKIQGKFAVQTPYLGGIEKEEQKVAPEK